jgi:hypothetical protein
MEEPQIINQPEEEIRTRLTGIFHYLRVQAVETNLLCVMDIEALSKLAALNQLQQRATSLEERSVEFKELSQQFKLLYNWLHEINHYYIYRDEQTGLWRLGIYLRRTS